MCKVVNSNCPSVIIRLASVDKLTAVQYRPTHDLEGSIQAIVAVKQLDDQELIGENSLMIFLFQNEDLARKGEVDSTED